MSVFVWPILMVITIYLVQCISQIFRQIAFVKNLPHIPLNLCLPLLRHNKKTTDIYNLTAAITNAYDGMAKMWFGSQLVVVCDDPVNMKTILMSKDCLDKPSLHIMATFMGNGILTAPSKFLVQFPMLLERSNINLCPAKRDKRNWIVLKRSCFFESYLSCCLKNVIVFTLR